MRRQKAFTLTELIVALGLGAIILMVVTMSLNTAIRAVNRTTSQVNLHTRGYAIMSRLMNELESIVPCEVNNDSKHIWYPRYLSGDQPQLFFLTSKSTLDTNYDGKPSGEDEPPHDLVWVRYYWVGKKFANPTNPYQKYGYLIRKEVPAVDPAFENQVSQIYNFINNADPNPNPDQDEAVTEYIFDRNVTDFAVYFNDDPVSQQFNNNNNDEGWPRKITVRYKLYDPKTESEKEFGFTVDIPGL